ncbi:MAG TPA: hypothetical protein VK832_18865 [Burkholderiaceae bacterium]|nr:hypothetical protein [Burkholderiaceae bacterium]
MQPFLVFARFGKKFGKKKSLAQPSTRFTLQGGITLYLVDEVFPVRAIPPKHTLLIGILFIIGFAFSVINGMLYKVVPFLVWYHLQNQMSGIGKKAPNVKQIISDKAATGQFCAHISAFTLLLIASIWPHQLARLAALAFVASSAWLWGNIASAIGIYLRDSPYHSRKMGYSC